MIFSSNIPVSDHSKMAPITIGSVAGSMNLNNNNISRGPCQWTQYQSQMSRQCYRPFGENNNFMPFSMDATAKSTVLILSSSSNKESHPMSPHAKLQSFLRKLRHSFRESIVFFVCFFRTNLYHFDTA